MDLEQYTNKEYKIRKNSTHFQFSNFAKSIIKIEGPWKRITGKSWMESNGNPAAMVYGLRVVDNNLPLDDKVLYGKIGSLGHLVHMSELEELC